MTQGLDNSVTPGGGGTILRRRLRPDGDGLDVEQEAALLALVAEVSPLPLPRVVAVIPEEHAMVMERMPGDPLLNSHADLRSEAARSIGSQLGELLAALGRIPQESLSALVPVEPSPLKDYHQDAERIYSELRRELPVEVVVPLADFLAAPLPAPAQRLQLCHNDLGAEHVFVGSSGDQLTGVIDWSDASLSDPCLDLGLIWRDLGESGYAAACHRLAVTDTDAGIPARAQFFARVKALEDFEFGLETGHVSYLHSATQALRRLF